MHRELSRSQSFYAQQQPTHSSNHGQIIPPRDPFQGYDMPTPYQNSHRAPVYAANGGQVSFQQSRHHTSSNVHHQQHLRPSQEQTHARPKHSSRERPSNSDPHQPSASKEPKRQRVHSTPAAPTKRDKILNHLGEHGPAGLISKPLKHLVWQYSNCTGRKKALLIGINYTGQANALKGCQNDAKNIRKFLMGHGYKKEDIVLLTDDSSNPRSKPTRRNMIDGMKWLVKDAKTHDSLFFHYSGHGGRTPDKDGDEVDGYDEVIFPLDFKEKGQITDDRLHDLMVKPLPIGCRLTAVIDCCHSGTALDLPYIYSSHGRLKGRKVTRRWIDRKATGADVISWSGCMDNQTSADTFKGGVAVGAMSHAFVASLTSKPNQSYKELLNSVRDLLDAKYSQKPQLGSSHHIDTSLKFKF